MLPVGPGGPGGNFSLVGSGGPGRNVPLVGPGGNVPPLGPWGPGGKVPPVSPGGNVVPPRGLFEVVVPGGFEEVDCDGGCEVATLSAFVTRSRTTLEVNSSLFLHSKASSAVHKVCSPSFSVLTNDLATVSLDLSTQTPRLRRTFRRRRISQLETALKSASVQPSKSSWYDSHRS